MIRKNGKAYVVLEFDDESDAAYFEISFNEQVRSDLFEAAMRARIGERNFSRPASNNINGPVTGSVIQANNISGGLNLGGH